MKREPSVTIALALYLQQSDLAVAEEFCKMLTKHHGYASTLSMFPEAAPSPKDRRLDIEFSHSELEAALACVTQSSPGPGGTTYTALTHLCTKALYIDR